MSLAIVYSRAFAGMKSPRVIVETHLSNGLPKFSIVGLPETIIKESKDRIRSAIINSHFDFPSRRITVNLAPADLPKMGSRFDLPIALGILAASHQIPKDKLKLYECVGELALSGSLRPINATLPLALNLVQESPSSPLFLPYDNVKEAALVDRLTLYPAQHLLNICQHLQGKLLISAYQQSNDKPISNESATSKRTQNMDLSDVYGQEHGKRALIIAAAGQHSLLMAGPPGCGKSMLAKRLITLLPDITQQTALEIAAVRSIAGKDWDTCYFKGRPCRSPHHSISTAALIGGGNPPQPGEISYAHQGVLLLDEFPEFSRHALESLREPMEMGKINIARMGHQVEFPARFQLIATMNLCPCGYYGTLNDQCRCTQRSIQHYQQRISGPLSERIDLHVTLPPVDLKHFTKPKTHTTTQTLKTRILKAYHIQLKRNDCANAHLTEKMCQQACQLTHIQKNQLTHIINQLQLSARAYQRALKVARTIADLEDSKTIEQPHLMEALSYQVPASKKNTHLSNLNNVS